MKARWQKVVLVLVAALGAVALVACGSNNDEGKKAPSELVLDSSVTSSNPVTVEMEGLTGRLYYSPSNLLTSLGQNRPVVHWEFTSTGGQPMSFRATVELRQNGQPIDAYFAYDNTGSVKNEMLVSGIGERTSSGLIPYQSGPRHDGRSEYIMSATGTDFEFILSDLQAGATPFTPTELVGRSEPAFADSPADQFNELAYRNGWTVPETFVSSYMQGGVTDSARLPAVAMSRLFSHLKDEEFGEKSNTSPTESLSASMEGGWDPEMLTTGIEMLGDEQVQEILRRVQDGDIEVWFGDGTWKIGADSVPRQIPPGTYRVHVTSGGLVTDGYWERTSASGDIIENNFITSAQEVTVTILPTDGQFTSSRLGLWKPVE